MEKIYLLWRNFLTSSLSISPSHISVLFVSIRLDETKVSFLCPAVDILATVSLCRPIFSVREFIGCEIVVYFREREREKEVVL